MTSYLSLKVLELHVEKDSLVARRRVLWAAKKRGDRVIGIEEKVALVLASLPADRLVPAKGRPAIEYKR